MRALPVYERFYAFQGEGIHMGRAAYFIRTYGCPVKCSWCDSAGTWHPSYRPSSIPKEIPAMLAQAASASGCEFVVITGGEPTIHNLEPLTQALRIEKLPIHLETSGAFKIKGQFDWVTVSPKWAALPLPENIALAHEIKIIVEHSKSIHDWLEAIPKIIDCSAVWLHPEWSKRDDPEILDAISCFVKDNGAPFRAGYQLHRLYNVDALDAGSRPDVGLLGCN